MAKIIKNVSNVDLGSNEIAVRYTLNRNLKKLFDNDVLLDEAYAEALGNMVISEYQKNRAYAFNDLVWFRDDKGDLYILRCVMDDNSTYPKASGLSFIENGWKDENEKINILDLGLSDRILRFVKAEMKEHELNEDVHKFGRLTSNPGFNATKLMDRELTNISPDRDINFYPDEFNRLEPRGAIVSGCYRKTPRGKYGVLEYDLVFRVGYTDKYNEDGFEILSANTVSFVNRSNLGKSDQNRNDNNRYFYSNADYKIFQKESQLKKSYSIVGSTIQGNRNDYCNVYSGEIEFPEAFSDRNYMVFMSDTTCYSEDGVLIPNSCHMVFTNKTMKSMTAMLVTYPTGNFNVEGWNAQHGGIASNSFHCRIIGKYRTKSK